MTITVKKTILQRLKENPLSDLLSKGTGGFFINDERLFEEGYLFFFLSTKRLLDGLSTGKLYERECMYSRKFGSRQKNIAKKFNELRIYLELDWLTFILITRILLDRYVKFIHPCFKGLKEKPSSSSFNKHRDFFLHRRNLIMNTKVNNYQKLIIKETGWFDTLKEIRDDFIVHSYKRAGYLKFIGNKDLKHWADEIVFFIPKKENDLSQINFPPLSLNCYDIVNGVYLFLKEANEIFK